MTSLAVEALIVGLVLACIGSIVSLGMMFMDPSFKLEKYTFWWQVFVAFFVTGALSHVLCEAIGVNRWYCTNGHACAIKQ